MRIARLERGLGLVCAWVLVSCGDPPGMGKGTASVRSGAPVVASSGTGSTVGAGTVGTGTVGTETTASVAGPMVFDAVRIDPATFLETPVGKVKFEDKSPFQGTVVEGDAAFRAIVEEANKLDHVMSSGLLNQPGTKVLRSEDQFFRIMRFGWLKSTHGVVLRDPAIPSFTATRWQVVKRDGKTYRALGTIELDGNDYLRVIGGPDAERPTLGKLAVEVNERYSFSKQIAPPPGKEGKWGRGVKRGTAEHRAHVRDKLLEDGFVLLPEGLPVPDGFTVERRTTSASTNPWLSVDVSGGFFSQPETPEVPLHLSGPPGGPSEVRVVRYRGLAYDASALKAHVASVHGKLDKFVEGATGEVNVAGRRLLASTFQTGKRPAARSHVVVMWPRVEGPEADAPRDDEGVLLEVNVTDGPKEAQALVDDASVRAVLQSLFIDLEPYD